MLVATAPIAAHAVPTGLAPGSGYRIAFVTTASSAQSSDITTYNAFAASLAALSPLTVSAHAWSVIASTPTVNAISNIACAGCANLPIYDTQNHLIAANTAALFSGTLQYAIKATQFGATLVNAAIWTGTDSDGTGLAGQQLGNASQLALLGLSDQTSSTYLRYVQGVYTGATFGLYALSDEVFVAGVPEPASLAVLGGGLALAMMRRRRSRA